MDEGEYDKALHRLLGVYGPVGQIVQPDGNFKLVYKLPDGTKKYLAPPQGLTDDQRAEVIEELDRHLRAIKNNRIRGD